MPPEAINMSGYSLYVSPTLYCGQKVHARLSVAETNKMSVNCCLYIRAYGEDNHLFIKRSDIRQMNPGSEWEIDWTIEGIDAEPIAEIGVEISSDTRADGTLYLDFLTWDGTPDFALKKPASGGNLWQQAWVNAANTVGFIGADMPTYRIIQNSDTGMLIQGNREWENYNFIATVNPHLAKSSGIAVCVQGLKRYYALLLCNDQKLKLIKELDGRSVLAEINFQWQLDQNYEMVLATHNSKITASINGNKVFEYTDTEIPLLSGCVALVCEEGRVDFGKAKIQPNS